MLLMNSNFSRPRNITYMIGVTTGCKRDGVTKLHAQSHLQSHPPSHLPGRVAPLENLPWQEGQRPYPGRCGRRCGRLTPSTAPIANGPPSRIRLRALNDASPPADSIRGPRGAVHDRARGGRPRLVIRCPLCGTCGRAAKARRRPSAVAQEGGDRSGHVGPCVRR